MAEKICVIGLGYVGLPLAVSLSTHFEVCGYDIDEARIKELIEGYDRTAELTKEEIQKGKVKFTSNINDIKDTTFYIIAVPTPVNEEKIPDLSFIEQTSELIGRNISKGSIVVLESTVYPGVTDEIVGPTIEKVSGLKCGQDFKLGYSPERINPGDKVHTIDKVIKVISGQDEDSLERIENVYSTICKAGLFKASSIKVAEACKVIENVQRDLNIAIVNELSVIFHKLGIETKEVLEAAGTKWNFLKFSPGLVGGHCIGIDPYYLTYKSQQAGYNPEVILAGRKLNDNMHEFVIELLSEHLGKVQKTLKDSKILVLGMTFKEDVKDVRNSKVINMINSLNEKGAHVLAYDPMLEMRPDLVMKRFNIEMTKLEDIDKLDAVIVAVPHKVFKDLTLDKLKSYMDQPILIDLKGFYDRKEAEKAGFIVDNL